MVRFHPKYFLIAIALLLLEIGIALFAHDKIIRPYAGDFLATIFLYYLAESFISASNGKIAVAVLLVSYLIEFLQYAHLLTHLGLHHYRLARIIFGSSFEWTDMLAYTLSMLAVILCERIMIFWGSHKLSAPY